MYSLLMISISPHYNAVIEILSFGITSDFKYFDDRKGSKAHPGALLY